jgi:pilus assembly protein Flp/PilA
MSATDLPAPPRRDGLFRRFARSRKGVTAIEFGMVAIPFLGLLCAIFETALVFFVQTAFDSAVISTTRAIGTNQYGNTPPTTVGGFVQAVPSGGPSFCSNLPSLINCSSVYLSVTSYPTTTPWTTINAAISRNFWQANYSSSYNATTSALGVTLPSPGVCVTGTSTTCTVLFQAFYAMPVYLSVLVASNGSITNFYSKPSTNVVANPSATGFVHTIFSTAVLRNEP